MGKVGIIILGFGGNHSEIYDCINNYYTCYEYVGFLDDIPQDDRKYLGKISDAVKFSAYKFINSIASPQSHLKIKKIIKNTGLDNRDFINIIHSRSFLSDYCSVSNGIVILQNACISIKAFIGNHCIILPNVSINHNVIIGDYTCIASGACISGNTTIGKQCYIGCNCSIKGNLKIGNRCMIGMGAVVLEDVEDNSVMVGNPARLLRKYDPE